MKKHLIALAILGSFTGLACAQSTVTLYGSVALGAVKTSGVSTRLDAGNGYNVLGFKGSEDLGGGLKANFDIQQRFSLESGGNDGSNNARPLFQGQTVVGLSGDFGAVNIGRAKTPYQAMEDSGTPFSSLVQGTQDLLASGYATDPRTNGGAAAGDGGGAARTDHIVYISPNLSGFTARVGYGFKNSAADGNTTVDAADTKNLTSLSLGYSSGPITAALGHEKNRRGDKALALTGSYNFQVAKLWLATGTNDVAATTGPKRKATTGAVSVPFGSFTGLLGFATVKAEGTGAKTDKLSLGATYTLSKRTYLYSTYGESKLKTTGVKTKGADLGLFHSF